MNEYVGYLISALLGAVGGGIVSYLYSAKIVADVKKLLAAAGTEIKKVI